MDPAAGAVGGAVRVLDRHGHRVIAAVPGGGRDDQHGGGHPDVLRHVLDRDEARIVDDPKVEVVIVRVGCRQGLADDFTCPEGMLRRHAPKHGAAVGPAIGRAARHCREER